MWTVISTDQSDLFVLLPLILICLLLDLAVCSQDSFLGDVPQYPHRALPVQTGLRPNDCGSKPYTLLNIPNMNIILIYTGYTLGCTSRQFGYHLFCNFCQQKLQFYQFWTARVVTFINMGSNLGKNSGQTVLFFFLVLLVLLLVLFLVLVL